MNEDNSGFFMNIVVLIVVFLTLFGYYKVVTDDYQYTGKDVMIAVVAFPYATYIGAANLLSDNNGKSERYEKCMKTKRYSDQRCRNYATDGN